MKKILIATSALAFAGSAFAAEVSGYAIGAFKKDDTDSKKSKSSMYVESEVYVSGSKTASNGLTFGATYTLGFSGDTAKFEGKPSTANLATDAKNIAGQKFTAGSKSQYATINAYVSSSFGRVDLGRHAVASRAIGGNSVNVGSYLDGSVGAVAGRVKTSKGITYTSPQFAGFQAAYTYEPGENNARSLAVKFSKDNLASGLGVELAYGEYQSIENVSETKKVGDKQVIDYTKPKKALSERKKVKAYGVKVSWNGFSASYTEDRGAFVTGKNATGQEATQFVEDKGKRIGVGYEKGGLKLGAFQTKRGETKVTGLNAIYTVASGLEVFIENQKTEGYSDTFKSLNSKATFVGTKISF